MKAYVYPSQGNTSKSTFLPFGKIGPDYRPIKNILVIVILAVQNAREEKFPRVKYFSHPMLFSIVI